MPVLFGKHRDKVVDSKIGSIFFDDYGRVRFWVDLATWFFFGLIIFMITFGIVFVISNWSCSAFAKINPDLEINFFLDGLQGCMAKIDGVWIDKDLLRQIP